MITVKLTYDDNQLVAFQMTGHADAGPYGQDIVCAAASVLAINTVNCLEQIAGVHPQVTADTINGGLMKVTVNEPLPEKAVTIMAVFERGIRDVAQNYYDRIRITQD
ncbi:MULTISPECIES: ribosomal-processing cysteine protease Prp [unclassified Ligilactobacillus]|uniref:ribosomal-processing cysteine protease Prp n=1 Tax=unclassified Ligilactobacillus TaxID=2767920 RepID=UPI00385256C7